MDVVIKTRARDLVPFVQLQTDLAKHSRLRGRNYVIAPGHELEQFAKVLGTGNILVAAEDVARQAGYTAELPDSWFTQQIIKIIAANFIENDFYLLLDSSTLIGFDFDEQNFLSANSNYVYAVNDFDDIAWELQSRNFLRLHTPWRLAGYRAVNQIFSKSNAQALIRHVESLYDDNFVTILQKYSDEFNTYFCTEYALYGMFVQSLLDCRGHCFEERFDLLYYSARHDFGRFLRAVERNAPLMIKFHKRRPGRYDLTVDEYTRHVTEIKRAYKRRLEMKGDR